ncbi:uncharacterized protein [Aristolochia californica]|uniref:uncharacterized protein n=1 Tax=Aristolochia californica TaxID=171875 RepID=UPI0035DD8679
MDRLAPLSEEPIDEEDAKKASRKDRSWRNWLKIQLQFPLFFPKKSGIKILLAVMGCPLSPVSALPRSPLDVESQGQYIIQQYCAATGCKKMEGRVKSVYAAGKVRMTMVEDAGPLTAQRGCFVMWQMSPDMWLVELVVAGQKVVAGSDGKLAWRHTPWLGVHAAKGGSRPLRRSLQGLDPITVAAVFSPAQFIGEKKMEEEDCFVLKLAADHSVLADRSDSTAETIKHVMFAYFSQRSGFLVYLEDSQLTRIQSPGAQPTYWETTIRSRMEDYRNVEGVMIAHSGHSSVSLTRFGDGVKVNLLVTRMEEVWTIDDVVFNVPGLSVDCFIPPEEVRLTFTDDLLCRSSSNR